MSEQDRSKYSVGIGFPCHRDVPWQTAMSLARTTNALGAAGIPCNIHGVFGSSLPHIARSVVATNYLENGDENFLFWVDSDIAWGIEDFFRVLKLASGLGIVCATYPIKRDPPSCIINRVEDTPVNEYGLLEIYGTGLGFCCVRRDIMVKLAKQKERAWHAANNRMIIDIFRCDNVRKNGRLESRGEDGAFFSDVRKLGYKVWLDPTIQLSHIGPKEYKMDLVKDPTDV